MTPTINAAAQVDDPDSVFAHFQRLIALRHDEPVVAHGTFRMLLPDDEQVYAFVREHEGDRLLVVANLSDAPDVVADLDEARTTTPTCCSVRSPAETLSHRPAGAVGVAGFSTEIGETAGPRDLVGTAARTMGRRHRAVGVSRATHHPGPGRDGRAHVADARRAAGGGGRASCVAGRNCGVTGTRASRPRPGARRRHRRAARVPVPSRDGGTSRRPAQGARARDAGVLEEGAGVPGHQADEVADEVDRHLVRAGLSRSAPGLERGDALDVGGRRLRQLRSTCTAPSGEPWEPPGRGASTRRASTAS